MFPRWLITFITITVFIRNVNCFLISFLFFRFWFNWVERNPEGEQQLQKNKTNFSAQIEKMKEKNYSRFKVKREKKSFLKWNDFYWIVTLALISTLWKLLEIPWKWQSREWPIKMILRLNESLFLPHTPRPGWQRKQLETSESISSRKWCFDLTIKNLSVCECFEDDHAKY